MKAKEGLYLQESDGICSRLRTDILQVCKCDLPSAPSMFAFERTWTAFVL